VSSGLLRRVALVRTDVSEEPGASFIRVTKIGELGTTQAAPFFIVTAVKTSNLTTDLYSLCSHETYLAYHWILRTNCSVTFYEYESKEPVTLQH
jgi:hypothetical protein